MTMKLLTTATVATLLTLGLLYAKGDGVDAGVKHAQHFKSGKHFGKILKQLALSDEQKASLKALRKEKRESRKAMMKEMRETKKATLANAVTAEGFNKEIFIKEVTKHFETKIAKRAESMEKMFVLLTPEQRVKFVTLLKAED
jgi:Spy/CpxP family protein refolding chaperone